ncbi:MAG: hypothetical protein ACI8XO_000501 [Verrucomicrobiales bacterium]|jgi:hypothetical protein
MLLAGMANAKEAGTTLKRDPKRIHNLLPKPRNQQKP